MSITREGIAAALADMGISVKAEFVPFSRSRNAKPKPTMNDLSLNWRVTLVCDGRDILTTDYSAGIAHCPGYKGQRGDSMSYHERNERIRFECEKGSVAQTLTNIGATYAKKQAITPDTADVVQSLIMDSDVIECAGFEEWASSYGYDIDSRRAEAIYRSCLEIALRIRAGIGDLRLAQLRVLFQDY